MVLEVLRFGTILGFDANTDLCIYLLYNSRYNLQFQINVENICALRFFIVIVIPKTNIVVLVQPKYYRLLVFPFFMVSVFSGFCSGLSSNRIPVLLWDFSFYFKLIVESRNPILFKYNHIKDLLKYH